MLLMFSYPVPMTREAAVYAPPRVKAVVSLCLLFLLMIMSLLPLLVTTSAVSSFFFGVPLLLDLLSLVVAMGVAPLVVASTALGVLEASGSSALAFAAVSGCAWPLPFFEALADVRGVIMLAGLAVSGSVAADGPPTDTVMEPLGECAGS